VLASPLPDVGRYLVLVKAADVVRAAEEQAVVTELIRRLFADAKRG
jgi:hypothetical protein